MVQYTNFYYIFCTCTRKHICSRNQNHIDLEFSIILINTRAQARAKYELAFIQSHVHLFNTQHLQVTTIHNFLVHYQPIIFENLLTIFKYFCEFFSKLFLEIFKNFL